MSQTITSITFYPWSIEGNAVVVEAPGETVRFEIPEFARFVEDPVLKAAYTIERQEARTR